MEIVLRGNRVAIEKIKKQSKNPGSAGFLVLPDTEEYQGIIRYVGEGASKDLEVNQKVFFSTNYQQVRMQGLDLCIVADTEVYAIAK